MEIFDPPGELISPSWQMNYRGQDDPKSLTNFCTGGSPLFLGVQTTLKSLTSFAERFCHSEQKKGYPPVQQFVQTADTTRQIEKLLIWILREKVLFWEFSQKCSSRISLYKVRFTFWVIKTNLAQTIATKRRNLQDLRSFGRTTFVARNSFR